MTGHRLPTPAALGFRMPAEWERHAATWLAWPHKEASWPGKFEGVADFWVKMVEALAPAEQVNILVNAAAPAAAVRARIERAGVALDRVRLHEIETDDAWIRDHGPTFVTRPAELAAVDWRYNAWGGKYPPWANDDAVPRRIAERLAIRRFEPGIVLEGGSIDVNGRGTLLTTEQCLLNSNRNPERSREEIEALLRAFLGVRQVIWLGEGISGDDTDGHVDDIARFVAPDTVVAAVEEDPHDENHAPLQDNLGRLRRARDQDGKPLRIVPLPMPEPITHAGQRLPASYANFYIGNEAVLVPVFGQPRDREALAVLEPLFPGRRLIPIDATDLVWGLGAFHCVTQQQPALAMQP